MYDTLTSKYSVNEQNAAKAQAFDTMQTQAEQRAIAEQAARGERDKLEKSLQEYMLRQRGTVPAGLSETMRQPAGRLSREEEMQLLSPEDRQMNMQQDLMENEINPNAIR